MALSGRPKSPPIFLEGIVILYFERQYPKQNSVFRPKSNILAAANFGLATLLVLSPIFQRGKCPF